MNFELSSEQELIKEMVHDFANKEITPYALIWDQDSTFPVDVFKKMGELGLMGISFPEKYGGSNGDTIAYAISVEEVGRACGGVGLSYAATVSLGASPIYYFGTDIQKEDYLIPMASGKTLGAFGLTEPNAGSDAGGTMTKAVLDGENWIINGEKCWITNATYSNTLIVTAVTARDSQGKKKISSFIVPTNTPGLTITTPYDKMGVRASNTCEIILENVKVGKDMLLGKEGEGFKQFLYTLDGGRISIAALAVGIAQSALDKALDYAKERKQFGRSISSFQAIQFKLADMAMNIEAARQLVYKAAWLKDSKLPFTKEAAFAKLFATEMATKAANEALQIHGGYGYMKESGVEKLIRDAKLLEIGEGTSEIQRLVIARQLGC
ncbi:MAG: acyl-CoA dehydrogenase family protein [Bacillaceae bacterium]